MSLHAKAIRAAHAAGYRATDDGVVLRPDGAEMRTGIRGGYRFFTLPRSLADYGVVVAHKFIAFCRFGEEALSPGVHVRHLNSDPLDNTVGNLALGSHTDNMRDKSTETLRRVGRMGARKVRKLTPDQARAIATSTESGKLLAARYGVRKSTVSEIRSGKLYSDATGLEQQPRHRNEVPAHLTQAIGGAA